MVSSPHCGERATSAGPLTDMRRHATADTRLQIHLQNAGPMTVLQCGARDDLRRGEYFEFLRFSFHSGATIVIHERERSSTNRGPPGSRSRHLGIKRNFLIVAWCRYGCACRLFSRKRVVLSRSRLVVLQNMRPKMRPIRRPARRSQHSLSSIVETLRIRCLSR